MYGINFLDITWLQIWVTNNSKHHSSIYRSVTRGARAIYLGNMANNTTDVHIRDHLRAIGVSNVSDVLNLKCRINGQTSFCVSVDTQNDEDIMYKPENWPTGVRVRPFKERPVMRKRELRSDRSDQPRTDSAEHHDYQSPNQRSTYRHQSTGRRYYEYNHGSANQTSHGSGY